MRTSTQHLKINKPQSSVAILNQYLTKRSIYQDASKDAHQITHLLRIASETHHEFSRTSSIEDSYTKVSDKNDKHPNQEPWKNNGDKDDRS